VPSNRVVRRVRWIQRRFGGTPTAIARRAGVARPVVLAVLDRLAEAAVAGGRLSTYSVRLQRAVCAAYRNPTRRRSAIAQRFHISDATLQRILDAYRVTRRGSGSRALQVVARHRAALTPARARAVVRAYRANQEPVTALLSAYHITAATLYKLLRRHRVPLRSAHTIRHTPPRSARVRAAIVAAYLRHEAMPLLLHRYRALRLTRFEVHTHVRAAGHRVRAGHWRPLPPGRECALIRDARRGWRLAALTKTYHLTDARVLRILRAADVDLRALRHQEHQWPLARRRRLLRLARRTPSPEHLARIFRVSPTAIVRELAAGGVSRAALTARRAALAWPPSRQRGLIAAARRTPSPTHLARRFAVHPRTILRHLRAGGVTATQLRQWRSARSRVR